MFTLNPNAFLTAFERFVFTEIDLFLENKIKLYTCESVPEGMVLAKTKLEALQPSVSASWLQL